MPIVKHRPYHYALYDPRGKFVVALNREAPVAKIMAARWAAEHSQDLTRISRPSYQAKRAGWRIEKVAITPWVWPTHKP